MSFITIIGQSFAVDLCQRWLKRDTNQPLLFYGPEGVGKRTLALEVAKSLNCEWAKGRIGDGAILTETSPTRPLALSPIHDNCDACGSCHKIASGQHPDVRIVDFAFQAAHLGQELEKQQNLKIETILKERQRLLQSPVEGTWKVCIIDDAHRLTTDAANVLLKTLEEPPPRTALFLLTPFRDRLLATILSRCQPIRFRPLSNEEMTQCLKHLATKTPQVTETDPAALIELAQGSPGRALHMSRTEQIAAHETAERLWDSLGKSSPGKLISEAETRSRSAKLSRADVEARLLGLLIPATRSMHSGQDHATTPVTFIQNAISQLRQNVQPALVYDNVLLRLARYRSQVSHKPR